MTRTFFTLTLLAALFLARGAGATSIDLGDIYDTDVTTWAVNLSSGGFTDGRLPLMDVNRESTVVHCSTATQTACQDNAYGDMGPSNLGGTGNRVTGDQGPSTNIQSMSSSVFASPATLSLLGVVCLSLGLVLRRLL